MKKLCGLIILASTLLLGGCENMTQMGNKIERSFKTVTSKAQMVPPKAPETGVALLIQSSSECPQVKVLKDLASIAQFADPLITTPETLVASTKLEHIETKCTIVGDAVTLELTLDFSGNLGGAGVSDLNGQANYTYPYFLTVITPDGQILSKDVFALSMVYENKKTALQKREELRQIIPLGQGQSSGKFQVIIGFQLSEQELQFNRAQSFK